MHTSPPLQHLLVRAHLRDIERSTRLLLSNAGNAVHSVYAYSLPFRPIRLLHASTSWSRCKCWSGTSGTRVVVADRLALRTPVPRAPGGAMLGPST